MEDNDDKYELLVDFLSDHLWMRNKLDYDFLKSYSEFFYQGTGYRALFLDKNEGVKSFNHQSFSKTLEGLNEYVYNHLNYDKDFSAGKKIFVYQCEIEEFDMQAAMTYLKKNVELEKNL